MEFTRPDPRRRYGDVPPTGDMSSPDRPHIVKAPNLGTVAAAGLSPLDHAADVTRPYRPALSMPARMLRNFRVNHPYVAVSPLPYEIVSVLFAGGDEQKIDVPDGALAVMFTKNSVGDVYVNFRGVAQGPGANFDTGGTHPLFPSIMFYCYGVKQISVFGPIADTVVGAAFYIQDAGPTS